MLSFILLQLLTSGDYAGAGFAATALLTQTLWERLTSRQGNRHSIFYIILHRYTGVPMHEGYFLLANLINKSNYYRCRSSSFKLFFDQSTKPFASFGLRVPVQWREPWPSLELSSLSTLTRQQGDATVIHGECHVNAMWMPCECHECWMLTFIICFSVRVVFVFVCHGQTGESHKLMVPWYRLGLRCRDGVSLRAMGKMFSSTRAIWKEFAWTKELMCNSPWNRSSDLELLLLFYVVLCCFFAFLGVPRYCFSAVSKCSPMHSFGLALFFLAFGRLET